MVATPGRLLDHYNRRTVRLDAVRRVVLDECDEMLNMGFYKDVRKIIDRTPKERKLDLFSATLSREVLDISWLYQRDAEEILVERTEQSKPKIAQYYLESAGSQKVTDCERLIRQGQYGRVMIFCNTKRMVDEAQAMGADAVVNVRYASASIMQGAAEVMAYGTAVRFK